MLRLLARLLSVLWALLVGRKPVPECRHSWRLVAATPIPPVTLSKAATAWEMREAGAPITRLSLVCEHCNRPTSQDYDGLFTLADFKADKAKP